MAGAMQRRLVPDGADELRRNNFDALRLLLALMVVWSHSFGLWYRTESFEPLSWLLAGTYNSGSVAVLGFFSISGFLITISFLRARSWGAFLHRRVMRIMPGYLVAVTLCSLIVVPAFSTRVVGDLTAIEWGGLASNLVLRNYIIPSDAFGGGAVNGALWSIPYEFWCYLGVIGLGAAGLLCRNWIYGALALGVMIVRLWLDLTGRRPGGGFIGEIIGFPYFWFNVLPPFLLGGAVYLCRRHVPRHRGILIGLVTLTIVCPNLPLPEPQRSALMPLILPVTLTYAIFYVAFSERVRMHDAARFGDFSYGTYLWGFPVQQMLVALCKGWAPFPLFMALSLVGALVAGVLSWYMVERHFLRRVRHPSAPLQREAAIVAP